MRRSPLLRPRVGLFIMGLPLIWMALLMGRVRDVIISQADSVAAGGAMWVLAIETGVYALLALAAAFAIMRCSPDWTRRDVRDPRNLPSVVGGAAAFVVTGVVVWIIARSDLPGQVIAACWIGSIFGAMAGRVVMPDASTIGLLAGALLAGIAGHAVGAVMQGDQAVTAADAGTLWGSQPPASHGLRRRGARRCARRLRLGQVAYRAREPRASLIPGKRTIHG
jgi:hypothetical protein